MTFAELGLSPEILRAVTESGYTEPTPIQEQAIPAVLAGSDVQAAAQTGTGKTAAFTLPLLHRLQPQASTSVSPAMHPVRVLMLTPTRELAEQVYQSVKTYSKYVPLRATVVYGGVAMPPQVRDLQAGVEILVATPGRLLDHIEQKNVNLSKVQALVLDEADRMLDMGFIADIRRILQLTPATRQVLLFSATFPPEIKKLVNEFMRDPVKVEVARQNTSNTNITQTVHLVETQRKRAVLARLIREREMTQVLVFTKTRHAADRLARELKRDGVSCEAIHGDKAQSSRQAALDAFKAGKTQVLVATDVAARGLDIDSLPFVINFELSANAEDYVHRIGRTGRAGASGEAISLVAPEEQKLLEAIEKFTNRPISVVALPFGQDRDVVQPLPPSRLAPVRQEARTPHARHETPAARAEAPVARHEPVPARHESVESLGSTPPFRPLDPLMRTERQIPALFLPPRRGA